MTVATAWMIVYLFLGLSVLLMLMILTQKYLNLRDLKKQGLARDYLLQKYFDGKDIKMPFSSRFFMHAYMDIESQVKIESEIRKIIVNDLVNSPFVEHQIQNINSYSTLKRRQAVYYMSYLNHESFIPRLVKRFEKEKNEAIRFQIIYHLINDMDERLFYLTMKSLKNSSEAYQRWLTVLYSNHYNKIKPFIEPYLFEKETEVLHLLVGIAATNKEKVLKDFAQRIFHEWIFDPNLQYKALKAIAQMHPEEIANDYFCKSKDPEVQKIAILAAGNNGSKEMVDHLLESMNGDQNDVYRIQSISRIVYDSKQLLLYVLNRFKDTTSQIEKEAIAKVMSHRMDYVMLKLKDVNFPFISEMIRLLLKLHIIEDFIDFANRNTDLVIEQEIIKIIKTCISQDQDLRNEFSIYLNEKLLTHLGLTKKAKPFFLKEKATYEKRKVSWIIRSMIFAIVAMPLIFILTNIPLIFSQQYNFFELLIVHVNRYLVVYFMTVNSIYLYLLLLSYYSSKDRNISWKTKTKTLLFEHFLLPSISIVAPAYNEEKTIIESVTSLLNLKYPKYEVIVVNDGSKDLTLDVLIKHFDLERKHPFFLQNIPTKPLRGVYINRKIPNLIVIDKQNGGKADALNLGVNVAKNDYVCGIDADSLLEEDALLRLMSITLDDSTPYIAIGGNIVPVNDSIVDKGKVELTKLGNKQIVKFQTLEYLRAFTTGRIGWAKMKSLMIISGAFGVFRRTDLLKTGGYLTISGALKKDTVGEDMELVVRLTLQALKDKRKYRVDYVHHANCYTELPSDYVSLFKQRNRWQRGLLDILSYHRNLLFNPKYKQPGLIAFPYFFIFEMMGPFIEMTGYIALITGLVFGILNLPIVLILLAATIGYGMVISLFSLWITERNQSVYSVKETFIMVLVAIIENFGYRQMMSLHRITSTFSALRDTGDWGSQKRVGFKQNGG